MPANRDRSDDQIPGTIILNLADLQRLATTAANDAAQKVRQETTITEEKVEELIEHSLERFCERLGLPTDREGMDRWRRNQSALEAIVETRKALIDHGLKAVVFMFLSGIGTAIWLAIKGVK